MSTTRYEVKNRCIDLSNVPHYKKNTKIYYQWNKSIGCECYFEFGDISGVITIIDACRKNNT